MWLHFSLQGGGGFRRKCQLPPFFPFQTMFTQAVLTGIVRIAANNIMHKETDQNNSFQSCKQNTIIQISSALITNIVFSV